MSIIRELPEIVAVVRAKTSDVTAVVVEVAVEEEEEEEEEPALVQAVELIKRLVKVEVAPKPWPPPVTTRENLDASALGDTLSEIGACDVSVDVGPKLAPASGTLFAENSSRLTNKGLGLPEVVTPVHDTENVTGLLLDKIGRDVKLAPGMALFVNVTDELL